MKSIILIIVFLQSALLVQGQDLCKKMKILESKKGYVSNGSSSLDHINKIGIRYDLSEFYCGLDIYNSRSYIYTVNQQSDLIYFEEYYDSTHIVLKTQGYYRLTYIDSETGYCWLKDLVWNYYDNRGVLQKKEFYNRDKIVESPAMPQPTLTNSTFKKKE